jgi:hypothetical protein
MRRSSALARPILMTLTAALAGAAVAVAATTPSEGTIGTSVTLDAMDAGTVKPKVSIRAVGTKKKLPLRVVAFTTNTVTATVLTGRAGDYDVLLDTRNGTDEEFPAAFSIRVPDAQALVPAIANPTQGVTVTGVFFGTKRPALKVGGKKVKVTSFADQGIGFNVPTTLRNGVYDVFVKNRVGSDTLVGALTVRNSTVGLVPIKGAAKFTATVSGTAYTGGGRDVPAAEAVACTFREAFGTVMLSSRSSVVAGTVTTQQDFTLEVTADLNDGAFPKTVPATVAVYNRSEIGPPMPSAGNYDLVQSGGMVSVTFQRYVGGRIEGTFSGSINKTGGAPTAPATAVITNGTFIADVVIDAGGAPE